MVYAEEQIQPALSNIGPESLSNDVLAETVELEQRQFRRAQPLDSAGASVPARLQALNCPWKMKQATTTICGQLLGNE